jgi:hypothetical protein
VGPPLLKRTQELRATAFQQQHLVADPFDQVRVMRGEDDDPAFSTTAVIRSAALSLKLASPAPSHSSISRISASIAVPAAKISLAIMPAE